jgi:hypothetical protein
MNENLPDPAPPGAHEAISLSFGAIEAMLGRAIGQTAIAGLGIGLALWAWLGWPTAALFGVGAAISVASIYEWGRLLRIFQAATEGQKTPRGTGLVVVLFLVRMIVFGGAIYVSLKCFRGSPIALICGLGLALLGLVWQSTKLLRR